MTTDTVNRVRQILQDKAVYLSDETIREIVKAAQPQEQGVEAVADVPIHPRQGPLWANVRPRGADTPMPSYPMRPLMYADHPSTLKRLSPEQAIEAGKHKPSNMPPWGIGSTREDFLRAVRAIESALAAHNGMGVES